MFLLVMHNSVVLRGAELKAQLVTFQTRADQRTRALTAGLAVTLTSFDLCECQRPTSSLLTTSYKALSRLRSSPAGAAPKDRHTDNRYR